MPNTTNFPKGLGFVQDPEDHRDWIVRVARPAALEIPRQLSYQPQLSPIKDQGGRGSCVAFATCKAKEWQEARQRRRRSFDFSEEWVYEQIRLPGGGAYLRSAMTVLEQVGVPREATLPYRDRPDEDTAANFTPTRRQLHYASYYRAKGYARLTSLQEMIASLAANGPFILGVAWLSGWFEPQAKDGRPTLDPGQGLAVGGHAFCVSGYDLDRRLLQFANSWGNDWAEVGYAWINFDAVEQHLLDAWVTIDLDRLPAGLVVEQPEVAAA